jgi:hypothetical protein
LRKPAHSNLSAVTAGLREIPMYKIGTLPVRTRLPTLAWALAGLVTLFSMVSSLMQTTRVFNGAMPIMEQATKPEKEAHRASVMELLEMFRAF